MAICSTVAPICAQPTDSAKNGKATASAEQAVSPDQIEQWVIQLDDDRYDARQHAQQQLEAIGKAGLAEVASAAETGSLESATRAINIMLKWSESDQQDLRLATLEKLAKLPNRPREAAMASRLLAGVREQVALEALTRLGAKYVGDRGIQGIGNLQVVIGEGWQGGIDGLKHLADVPRTSTISLHAAPVDEQVFEKLAELPNLRRIEIYSMKMIAPEAIDKFKRQTPHVEVDFRNGALLGVHGHPRGQGRITDVEPNSAAAKAGLKSGDRITEFNGEKVADFKELTEKISEHWPGDDATLTVVRQAETMQVKVTFDDWGKTDVTKSVVRRRIPAQIQIRAPRRQLPLPPAPLPVQPKIELEK